MAIVIGYAFTFWYGTLLLVRGYGTQGAPVRYAGYMGTTCEVQKGLGASFVVRSSTGKYFVQALQHEAVLGSILCKLCSLK